MRNLPQLIEDICLGLALGTLLLFASGASHAAQLQEPRPLPTAHPAPTPTYPEPRPGAAGARVAPTPTYPEPRVGADLHASGHSFSFNLRLRF
jgi:hypothetical protein